jgi:hypothetical protein
MCGSAAVTIHTGERKFVRSVASTSSAVTRVACLCMGIAALFTITSIRPQRAIVSATVDSANARSARSPTSANDAGASAATLSTSAASSAPRRATATTVFPRRASASAVARPMPDDAPVTRQIRSRSRTGASSR